MRVQPRSTGAPHGTKVAPRVNDGLPVGVPAVRALPAHLTVLGSSTFAPHREDRLRLLQKPLLPGHPLHLHVTASVGPPPALIGPLLMDVSIRFALGSRAPQATFWAHRIAPRRRGLAARPETLPQKLGRRSIQTSTEIAAEPRWARWSAWGEKAKAGETTETKSTKSQERETSNRVRLFSKKRPRRPLQKTSTGYMEVWRITLPA